MDELGKRLSETSTSRPARLLDEASRLAPWPDRERARVWARLEGSTATRPGVATLATWAACAAAAGVLLALLLGRAIMSSPGDGWRTIELAQMGELEASPTAVLRVPSEQQQPADEHRVFLDEGRLRARIAKQLATKPFAVVTPHVRVVVVGTRFSVEVGGGVTAVHVEEGLVAVEAGPRRVLVAGGASVSSNDPRFASAEPPAPRPTPAPVAKAVEAPAARAERSLPRPVARGVDRCVEIEPVAARRDCLLGFATGEGLAAQAALYSLGRLEREQGRHEQAVDYWSMYSRRFPDGAFGPEVSWGLLGAYLALEKRDEALGETESFLRRFASDPHRAEVALANVELTCASGRPVAAAKALDELSAAGALREAAMLAKARCLLAAGDRGRAMAELERYLGEFPEGKFAGEARRLHRSAPAQ